MGSLGPPDPCSGSCHPHSCPSSGPQLPWSSMSLLWLLPGMGRGLGTSQGAQAWVQPWLWEPPHSTVSLGGQTSWLEWGEESCA